MTILGFVIMFWLFIGGLLALMLYTENELTMPTLMVCLLGGPVFAAYILHSGVKRAKEERDRG